MRLARENRLADALVDRLLVDDDRQRDVEQAVRDVAALPDPVGQLVDGWRLDNVVELRKVRVPLGVIACSGPQDEVAQDLLDAANELLVERVKAEADKNQLAGDILAKLQVRDRTEAVTVALRRGIVHLPEV